MLQGYWPSIEHVAEREPVYEALVSPVGAHVLLWAAMDQALAVRDGRVPEGPEKYVLDAIPDVVRGSTRLFGCKPYWESVESMLHGYFVLSQATPRLLTCNVETADESAVLLQHTLRDKKS